MFLTDCPVLVLKDVVIFLQFGLWVSSLRFMSVYCFTLKFLPCLLYWFRFSPGDDLKALPFSCYVLPHIYIDLSIEICVFILSIAMHVSSSLGSVHFLGFSLSSLPVWSRFGPKPSSAVCVEWWAERRWWICGHHFNEHHNLTVNLCDEKLQDLILDQVKNSPRASETLKMSRPWCFRVKHNTQMSALFFAAALQQDFRNYFIR